MAQTDHHFNINQPLVGVGVMIFKGNQVLLGKRKGTHGAGEYAFPGGHLEYLESFADCARRETREECGLEITNIRFLFLANVKKYTPKHYVHIGLIADYAGSAPEVKEPDRVENWAWYDLANLPSPLFNFCSLSFDSYKTGKNYYDQV